MTVDEETSKSKGNGSKEKDEESSSDSDTFKEDEGKRQQQGKKRKKKEQMSELSPAREVTEAENFIREGQGAPSPILPKSSVQTSEHMHAVLLSNDPIAAAKILGMDEQNVPMLSLMQKQAALRETDKKQMERTTAIAVENKGSIRQSDE
eukprot:1435161-Karenia_brevis.AAC.1